MKKILDMKKMSVLALGLIAFAPAASAQDEVETTIAADVVSQYIWRGQDLGNVSLQPTLGIGYKGFSLTGWGSVGLSKWDDTKEFDLTAAYSTGGLTIGILIIGSILVTVAISSMILTRLLMFLRRM